MKPDAFTACPLCALSPPCLCVGAAQPTPEDVELSRALRDLSTRSVDELAEVERIANATRRGRP